nr:uncharacterized protein LOC129159905 [Nothobranchius furzeri]
MEDSSDEEYVPEPATDYDLSWESLRPGGKGKGSTGKGRGKGRSDGRGRTRSRGEGRRSRSRAPSRGPGRRGRQRTAFREEDRDRLAQLRAASIAEMQTALQHLSQEERDYILERVVTRLPGVMLDILEFWQETPGHRLPDRGQPAWCTCQNCRRMPTQIENLCCRQVPELCLSRSAHLELYCLDEGTLHLVRMTWNDIFALEDNQDVGTDSFILLRIVSLQSGNMGVWEEEVGDQFQATVFYVYGKNSLIHLGINVEHCSINRV